MPLYMGTEQCPPIIAGDLQQGIMPAEETRKERGIFEKSNKYIYAETNHTER